MQLAKRNQSVSSLKPLEPKRCQFRIQDAVLSVFDLRPAAIIRDLDLLRPIYSLTSAYGHFGRELAEFSWEKTDRAAALQAAIK
jgi:S-adenosylmethionine synthetase